MEGAGLLWEEPTPWGFIVLTLLFGAGAAYLSGRAVALTWRPLWQLLIYVLLLAAAVRFLRFALWEGTLLSPYYYVVDALILLLAAFAGFRLTRTGQMVTQYRWIYEKAGPFSWRVRPGMEEAARE